FQSRFPFTRRPPRPGQRPQPRILLSSRDRPSPRIRKPQLRQPNLSTTSHRTVIKRRPTTTTSTTTTTTTTTTPTTTTTTPTTTDTTTIPTTTTTTPITTTTTPTTTTTTLTTTTPTTTTTTPTTTTTTTTPKPTTTTSTTTSTTTTTTPTTTTTTTPTTTTTTPKTTTTEKTTTTTTTPKPTTTTATTTTSKMTTNVVEVIKMSKTELLLDELKNRLRAMGHDEPEHPLKGLEDFFMGRRTRNRLITKTRTTTTTTTSPTTTTTTPTTTTTTATTTPKPTTTTMTTTTTRLPDLLVTTTTRKPMTKTMFRLPDLFVTTATPKPTTTAMTTTTTRLPNLFVDNKLKTNSKHMMTSGEISARKSIKLASKSRAAVEVKPKLKEEKPNREVEGNIIVAFPREDEKRQLLTQDDPVHRNVLNGVNEDNEIAEESPNSNKMRMSLSTEKETIEILKKKLEQLEKRLSQRFEGTGAVAKKSEKNDDLLASDVDVANIRSQSRLDSRRRNSEGNVIVAFPPEDEKRQSLIQDDPIHRNAFNRAKDLDLGENVMLRSIGDMEKVLDAVAVPSNEVLSMLKILEKKGDDLEGSGAETTEEVSVTTPSTTGTSTVPSTTGTSTPSTTDTSTMPSTT
ncbi:unnamed protein product, partial [Cylicostephanus goldi]